MNHIDEATGEIIRAEAAPQLVMAVQKYVITPTGLQIDGALTLQEWIACGSQIVDIKNAIQWCIGDWMEYGEGRGNYGETYAQAEKRTLISYDTLTKYTYAARRFKFFRRRKNLSFSHHLEVVHIDDDDEQDRLLDVAEAKQMSVSEFRDYLKKKPHVSHNSGENEWYTPAQFIEAARLTMGSIDLDPASSEIANQIVQAETFYTLDDNGLEQDWFGNVWLNPPYAQPEVSYFADKVVAELDNIRQICVLVNNATDTAWFHALLAAANCVCFVRGRVKFLDTNLKPNGAPLQGQAILYLGNNTDQFAANFGQFGVILYADA